MKNVYISGKNTKTPFFINYWKKINGRFKNYIFISVKNYMIDNLLKNAVEMENISNSFFTSKKMYFYRAHLR